ncbi:MAG: hypothetical protein WC208_10585 [Gallionella sp.]|jgi:ribosomal protein S17E
MAIGDKDTVITKEELLAMLDVQSKNAEHLILIATHFQTLVESQNKILARLQNGMAKEIKDGVNGYLTEALKTFKEQMDRVEKVNTSVKDDTRWIKVIFGSIAIIVAIGMVIMQLIHWLGHVNIVTKAIGG